jgi:hypothetical protein
MQKFGHHQRGWKDREDYCESRASHPPAKKTLRSTSTHTQTELMLVRVESLRECGIVKAYVNTGWTLLGSAEEFHFGPMDIRPTRYGLLIKLRSTSHAICLSASNDRWALSRSGITVTMSRPNSICRTS